MFKLLCGDCLDLMKDLESNSIDLIICDLPYNKTKNYWDQQISLPALWEHYNRIIKDAGTIVLFGDQPFTSQLIWSSTVRFRYSLVYQKTQPTGFLNSKIMPLRAHEDILVFGKSPGTYNPQKTSGHPRKVVSKRKPKDYIKTANYNEYAPRNYDSTERFPTSILTFSKDSQTSKLHSTQKPLLLMEYLIKTYSNEDDLILDNCMGSGTTGVAAKNLNRKFIGIEKDEGYFNIAAERINALGKGT